MREKIPDWEKLRQHVRVCYLEKLPTDNDGDPCELAARSWPADLALLRPTMFCTWTPQTILFISVNTREEFWIKKK